MSRADREATRSALEDTDITATMIELQQTMTILSGDAGELLQALAAVAVRLSALIPLIAATSSW